MKPRALPWIIPLTLFMALVTPSWLPAQVAGGGTTNRIPIWTNSNTLGNSNLFQTGGKVGVGTTGPAATLDVIGPTATTAGAAALTVLRVTGGRGGSLPLGTFGSAGAGGGLQLTSGNGGSAGSASGGGLARIMITGGTGGSCIPASSRCAFVAGKGGSISLEPGVGSRPGSILLAPTGGRVGIGVASPVHTLEINVGGTTLADAWTTRSSRHFKANIQPLQGALAKVERLQGVSYERKSDAKREIGVIAEDVEEIVPEVVSRDSETHDVDGVDYSRLTALLIEAIKSQQAELRTQQSEIQQLKAKVVQLTSNSSTP